MALSAAGGRGRGARRTPFGPHRPPRAGIAVAKRKAKEDGRSFEPPPRWGYHSFRRKFATELKGAPDKDVADLGGWKDLNTLREIYQMADHDTMVAALTSRMELRNRKAQG